MPGEHNVRNALAAAAAALALRVPVRGIREGLGAFRGAGRRFEHKGTYRGRRSMTTTPTTLRSCGPC